MPRRTLNAVSLLKFLLVSIVASSFSVKSQPQCSRIETQAFPGYASDAVFVNGLMLVADFQYHVIRTFNMSSKHVSTLAGVESLDSVFVDGTSRSARFTGPTSVAGDQDPSMQHNTAPVKSKCFPSSALARQPPLLLSPPLTQNDLLSKAEAEAGADLHDETKLSSSSFSSFGDSSESDL